MRLLTSEKDFIWYKKELDLTNKYEYKHIGTPVEFPCIVESHISDYGGLHSGPAEYDHDFTYKIKRCCSQCKHTSLVWPDNFDQFNK